MERRVHCPCTICSAQTYVDELGVTQRGKMVARSTRTKHKQHDQLFQLEPPKSVHEQKVSIGNIDVLRNNLWVAVCSTVAWLHLCCGLSRDASSRLLKALCCIVKMAMEIGAVLQSRNVSDRSVNLPKDARFAISSILSEPVITRMICCPKCFTPYSLEDLPNLCLNRETPKSLSCKEELWTIRSTPTGPRRVPRRLYSTQNFESWLQYFLSSPTIEEHIDKSYEHIANPASMRSLWDSPAWKHLPDNFSTTPGNLTFSFYIDWFNPFSNKIAGKKASCGAIMMFCLNLPYDMQKLPENTYFAGITPPPYEPTIITINSLLEPIVDALIQMYHGRTIKTYRHPQGVKIRVAILVRIGDLGAIRKCLGFASATSTHFCSFCTLSYNDIEDLDFWTWTPKNGEDVNSAAISWKQAPTKKARDQIFKTNGVRWSALNLLPYGDPVQHTMLGMMHNWLEGILQHHARVLWRIGIPKSIGDDDDIQQLPDGNDNSIEQLLNDDEVDDDAAALAEESESYRDTPRHKRRMLFETNALLTMPVVKVEEMEEDSLDDLDDLDAQVDYRPTPVTEVELFKFSEEELGQIRSCIAHAVVPSWIERPPRNLGEKTHGKLKADQWFVLFSIFLPLVLPELWLSYASELANKLLNNFYDLVYCTNILCSYTVTATSAPTYMEHYLSYRKSSQALFPFTSSRPNHHFAMHNAELMKFWGPLVRLSEFSGERHNGMLQKIKTNNHMWQLDFTMLRQMCRRGRITAFLKDSASSSSFNTIFFGQKSEVETKRQTKGPGKAVPKVIYEAILNYMNQQSPSFRHYKSMPHAMGDKILPCSALPISQFVHNGRQYSTFTLHPGNSSIHFKPRGFGHIESVWRFNLDNDVRTFIVVNKHQSLSEEDEYKNPFLTWPGFLANLVYTRNGNDQNMMIIEPSCIVGHVAFYERPPGTFGIERATTVLIDSLHRDRD